MIIKYWQVDGALYMSEFTRETKGFVFRGDVREAKVSKYRVYYDTRKEAFQSAINQAESKLRQARYAVKMAEDTLKSVLESGQGGVEQ